MKGSEPLNLGAHLTQGESGPTPSASLILVSPIGDFIERKPPLQHRYRKNLLQHCYS